MKQSGPGVTAQQPGRTLVPERVEEEGQSVFVFCIFVFLRKVRMMMKTMMMTTMMMILEMI